MSVQANTTVRILGCGRWRFLQAHLGGWEVQGGGRRSHHSILCVSKDRTATNGTVTTTEGKMRPASWTQKHGDI